MRKEKERNINIDLIKCVAVFFVIAVHFLLYSNYYGENIAGIGDYVMTVIRVFTITCVPLFMTTSGYLMNKKKLTKEYYKAIWRVLIVYLFSSIVIVCFKKFYIGYQITFKNAVLEILGFSGPQYSWYISFYIGLFLLVPFINLMWSGLTEKKHRQFLLITLIFLTVVPSLFNIYDWRTEGFFLKPWISNVYQNIFPTWWIGIYPLTYYFLGAYIEEYDIKIGKGKNILLIIFFAMIFGTFNFFRNYGVIWDNGIYMDYFGFESFILTTLLFLFLLHLKLNSVPDFIKKTISAISKLSLGTYLLSYISDNFIYPKLLIYTGSLEKTIKYFVPTIIVIFILSNVLSFLLQLVIDGLKYCLKKLKHFSRAG